MINGGRKEKENLGKNLHADTLVCWSDRVVVRVFTCVQEDVSKQRSTQTGSIRQVTRRLLLCLSSFSPNRTFLRAGRGLKAQTPPGLTQPGRINKWEAWACMCPPDPPPRRPSCLPGPWFSVATMRRAWARRPAKCSMRNDQFFMNASPVLWEASSGSRRAGPLRRVLDKTLMSCKTTRTRPQKKNDWNNVDVYV